jgi:hypothetical protein
MISNIYTSQMHQRISKPSARGKYSDVLHYIRVYMQQSEYMTILAGQIEAIPYWESILQPVQMQMKDLDAHEKEDNHASSDKPAKDRSKKPADSKPSRDSQQKPSDPNTEKKFFYRKPKAKVSYIDAADEELYQLGATEPEVDPYDPDTEFYDDIQEFPCAEEERVTLEDEAPEYEYVEVEQVQHVSRHEQTPPEPLNAFTPNPQFMPVTKPQQAEQRTTEGNICHSYFIDGTCPKGDACYYASTHDPRLREAVFRAKFPDGRIPSRPSPAQSPPQRTPPRVPTPNRVLRRPPDGPK